MSRSTMSAMPKAGTQLAVEGDLGAKDGLVRFRQAGRTLAVASLFRDRQSLEAEVAMEAEGI